MKVDAVMSSYGVIYAYATVCLVMQVILLSARCSLYIMPI